MGQDLGDSKSGGHGVNSGAFGEEEKHDADHSGGIRRQPTFWTGITASIAIAIAAGTQRTPSGPTWWLASLFVAALSLMVGVVVATLRHFSGEPARELWSRVNVRLFATAVAMLLSGLGWVLVAQTRSGIIETLKATCFMYGGIAAPLAVLSACLRFLSKRSELRLRWGLFGAVIFFWVFVVGGAMNSSSEELATGKGSRVAGLVLIIKSLLGLTKNASPFFTALAWFGIVAMVASLAFAVRGSAASNHHASHE